MVDDNQTNLAILTELLESDFALRAARNGEEALRVAEEFEPGIILLDVMMPGLDGCETCRRLRAMPSLHGAIIIMLSAKAMPSEEAAGIDAGADDYVTKPFDDGELLAKVRGYAHTRSAPECLATKRTPNSAQWKVTMPRSAPKDNVTRPA
jgi:DNA-binding response OmpR family regulator